MAIGKYLSLEEARKLKQIERFCIEHPSMADEDRFGRLLNAMAKPKSSEEGEKT